MKMSRFLSCSVRHCSKEAAAHVIPQAKGLPLIGTMWDLIRAGGGPKLHVYINNRHRQLGPIFRETLGPVTATFISDPKDMRSVFAAEGKYPVHLLPDGWVLYNKLFGCERGLFFMNGEEWYKHRQIMNKIMLKTELSEGLMNAYKAATKDLVERWSKNSEKPVENVVNHVYNLSISYTIAALLGSSYPRHKDELRPSVEQFSSVVHLIFEHSTKLSLLPAKMAATLRLPVWRHFVSAVDITLNSANMLVTRLIPLAASDGVLSKMAAENISLKRMVSIVIDLILAGADTTPYTMIWILYLLARHQDIQSELADAIRNTSAKDQLSHPLLRAVVRETLRLYPAAPFLTRALAADTKLSGYLVPTGEMMILSVYTSGRSEEYFPSADKFWPQRWLREGESGNYQAVNEVSASLPFAMGGRACIGRKIAEAQLSLTLFEILTRFQVEVKKEIEMVLMLVPVPSEPVTLHLTKRDREINKNT